MTENTVGDLPDGITAELNALKKRLAEANKNSADKVSRDVIIFESRLYVQLESLSWLQQRLMIKGCLPPLRGWAAPECQGCTRQLLSRFLYNERALNGS